MIRRSGKVFRYNRKHWSVASGIGDPMKRNLHSPNTKISRGNWSLVVVRKFIAENIISYRNRNEHPGILLTNLDFHLQTGNLGYKTGLSFTKRESWVTKGILGLLFTFWLETTPWKVKNKVDDIKLWFYNRVMEKVKNCR